MKTIEVTATIERDGKLIVQLPPGIPAGEHRVVLMIDEQLTSTPKRAPTDFPVIHVSAWPENLPLRRQDLYNERGR